MRDYLQIQSQKALDDLDIKVEPEYNMSESQIIQLITTDSLDAFLDCLDFAPVGVIDLIKKLSVSLPMNDNAKREALKKKTGFDVTKALENSLIEQEDKKEDKKERRSKASNETETPTRRTSGTNYKIVK